MVSSSRNLWYFVWLVFLWKLGKIKAYVDVCEFSPMTIYCNCEELSRDSASYRVTCIIFQDVEETNTVWRSIGDSENIAYLKLQPRLPVVLNYIPSNDLKRMPNLRTLRIQEGRLGTLKSYAVSGYKSLEELEINDNDIEALEPHAISKLPKLKKLTLSQNSLQELLADSLSDLLELEILFLDSNNISRIETCAFCNLQNLKELEMWGNQISDLTEYTFRGLRFLRRLDLFKNKIRILNDKVFHSMPVLLELDLKDNLISYISARAFVGLEKLQTLTLGNNRIKVLPDEVFAPLLNLRSVDLYQNQLEVLHREVVDNIKNTKHQYFSLSFKENPYICDCAMRWVSSYLNSTNSHLFKRELEAVTCKFENKTVSVLEYIEETNCKTTVIKPRLSPVLITNLITKSTDSIPIELSIEKSKTMTTAAASEEGTEEAYLSDVDKTGVDDSNNASHQLNVQLHITIFVLFLNVIMFAYRREM